jgi:hypothetical protein
MLYNIEGKITGFWLVNDGGLFFLIEGTGLIFLDNFAFYRYYKQVSAMVPRKIKDKFHLCFYSKLPSSLND